MLSLELKNIFINLENGDWDAIGEHINSDIVATDEEYENGNYHYLDKVILYSNIPLPNKKEMEESIEIKFEKTENEFLKSFENYRKSFPTNDYKKEISEKQDYTISEYNYITNYLKEKINKSYNKLKEKGYIAT